MRATPNALFVNESDTAMGMLFFDEGQRSGIGRPSFFDLGWGANLIDVDLDGDRDLFVANGHVYPHVDGCDITNTAWAQRNRVFEQVGPVVVGNDDADSWRAHVTSASWEARRS